MADLAPEPPAATEEQTNNAVRVTLSDFQKANVSLQMRIFRNPLYDKVYQSNSLLHAAK